MQKQLSRLDYFTLKVLIGLFEFKNGSIVAEKLNSTQPKISRALSNMREVIHDELFIRKQYGLQPNAMASRLYPLAKAIIAAYDEMAQVANRQPLQQKVLHIAAPEHMSSFILDAIEQVNQDLGISRTVDIHPWADNVEQYIAQGKIDYAFGTRTRQQENVQISTLAEVKYWFLAVKKNHPILKNEITMEAIFNHKLVLTNNGPIADLNDLFELCAQKVNQKPEVSLMTSSLFMAFEKVVNSNDICLASTIFPYFIGEKRDDIELVDITGFYNKNIKIMHEWKVPLHSLQYHDSHEQEFTDALTQVMTTNLAEYQACYENTQLQ
ncbi:LysR family transcriptional regulator [Shewanella sp. 10N.286.51.B8]|uniref:LysR family transcriptional regulator n=1 Tax=Shewanella sp. 10N.286.51.B8 TaxID=3229708 RepID=UPI00354B7F52